MTRFEPWHLCFLLFPCLTLLHLYISPYTKVEESFNIQAAHDILTYGIPTQNIELRFKAQYDHMEFPGAVPRTFIGALMLAGTAQPILWLKEALDRQMVVRGILGAFNALSLIVYATGVRKAFGNSVAGWFVLFQASQFHVFYYASRTLPNMFAFGISTPRPLPFLIHRCLTIRVRHPGSSLAPPSTRRGQCNKIQACAPCSVSPHHSNCRLPRRARPLDCSSLFVLPDASCDK